MSTKQAQEAVVLQFAYPVRVAARRARVTPEHLVAELQAGRVPSFRDRGRLRIPHERAAVQQLRHDLLPTPTAA